MGWWGSQGAPKTLMGFISFWGAAPMGTTTTGCHPAKQQFQLQVPPSTIT